MTDTTQAEPLTFEQWWRGDSKEAEDSRVADCSHGDSCRSGWNARQPEIDAANAALVAAEQAWTFVGDKFGGHLRSIHGDKWYPEVHTEKQTAELRNRIADLERQRDDLRAALNAIKGGGRFNVS